MRFDATPYTILLIIAVVLFILAAINVDIGSIALVPLGLAAFAGAFLFGGGGGGLKVGR